MKILNTIAFALFLATTTCAQNTEVKPTKKAEQTTKEVIKLDYSKVDYSRRSNIIKNPTKLTGDEKAIFYHPYFLNLTSEEVKNLEPLKVKEEFAKLGITLKENERFGMAYVFFDTSIKNHKKSCENWHFHFNDLDQKSQN